MPSAIGTISIDLKANTATLREGLDDAKKRFQDLGSHGVSSVQATSAALRTLEGGIANNVRAAERFVAQTLGLGNALKTAFPVFGALALGGVLGELVSKAGEAYQSFKRLQEAPGRIGAEFADLAQPIAVANDELRVSNDRLENEIAKLQGKPQNGLMLALDEARLASDKLGESLDRTLKQVGEIFKNEQVGFWKGLVTNTAPTTGLSDNLKTFRDQLTGITDDANKAALGTNDPHKQAQIFSDATAKRNAALDSEIARLQEQLDLATQVQKTYTNYSAANATIRLGAGLANANIGRPQDQSNLIAQLSGELLPLRQERVNSTLLQQNSSLSGQKDSLEAARANAQLGKPVQDKLAELRAQLAGATTEANAAGSDKFTEALARGAAEATKAIAELNVRLKETHQSVSLADALEITGLERSIALQQEKTQAADDWAQRLKNIQNLGSEMALAVDTENQKRNETLVTLNAEIDAAQKLHAAESQGSEAIWQAQEKLRLSRIQDPTIQGLTQQRDQSERADQIAGEVSQIDRQTEATQRLSQAYNQGLAARRQAELDNIRNSGQSPDVIAAQLQQKQGGFTLEDTQSLKTGTAADGAKAYFQQVADGAKSAAQTVHDTLGAAFESLNSSLVRLVEGQKVSWASFFEGIAGQIAQIGLNNIEGSIFKSLLGGSSSSSSSSGGGFLSILSGIFGGFRAGGGPVDSSSAYVVGENGPEVFMPGSSGQILNRSQVGGLGAGASYFIDARGSNAADVEMRVSRALTAVHGSAVRNAVAVQREVTARSPRSKFQQ